MTCFAVTAATKQSVGFGLDCTAALAPEGLFRKALAGYLGRAGLM